MRHFFEFLVPSKKTIVLMVATAAIAILITTFAAIWLSMITDFKVPSLGTIITIGVEAYWDGNLENKTESINWDTIWPGSSQNVTLYMRSLSNIKTTLNLNATNWNPTNLSDYMNLTWNYNGTTVHPGEVIQVTLTLSASSSKSFILYLIINDVKQFSFDIIISSSEVSAR